MKIKICSPSDGWILNKFADATGAALRELGENVTLSNDLECSDDYDMNHIFFSDVRTKVIPYRTTFMVTHIDMTYKLEYVKQLTDQDAIGICMSRETMNNLVACGVRRDRICYINPAQDGKIRPRKIILGIMHKTHNDQRNRESTLVDICKEINSNIFQFIIMGSGWDRIIDDVRKMGFDVEYYPTFDKEKYNEIIPRLDYYCFWGFDEGSMGFMDAIAAGVKTIVTPQGFHLDMGFKIDYPVKTISDVIEALHGLEREKNKHIHFAEEYTWRTYALKHLEIWRYMHRNEKRANLLCNKGRYMDGIFSLLLDAPSLFPKGTRVILWGAGIRGRRFFDGMKLQKCCEIILWVDSNFLAKQKEGLEVRPIEDIWHLKNSSYDYIYIAIRNPEWANDVKDYLISNHIDEKKIILSNWEEDMSLWY